MSSNTRFFTAGGTRYEPKSVHYNRRKYDGVFEVVGRALIEDDWRWVTIATASKRVDALARVKELRGTA